MLGRKYEIEGKVVLITGGVHSIGRTPRVELAHTGAKVGVAYFAEIDTDMTRVARKEPVEVASKALVRGIERRSIRNLKQTHREAAELAIPEREEVPR